MDSIDAHVYTRKQENNSDRKVTRWLKVKIDVTSDVTSILTFTYDFDLGEKKDVTFTVTYDVCVFKFWLKSGKVNS